MAALTTNTATPLDWHDFLSTAKRLLPQVSADRTTIEEYKPNLAGETAFDFTKPTPKYDNLDDANECIDRLWHEGEKRVARLQAVMEKANQDSTNSSLPGSQDSIATKAERAKNSNHTPSGKKQGAQPGHKASWRKLIPTEDVDEVVVCPVPTCCRKCDAALPEAEIARRKQVSYFRDKRHHIVEYQLQGAKCTDCGKAHKGKLPKGTPRGAFGACMLGLVALITGRYRMSKRDTKGCLNDVLGVDISIGSISNGEHTVSQAIEVPTEEVHEVLKAAPVTNNDETGHYRQHKRTWLWLTANAKFAYFKIMDYRNADAAKYLLGAVVNHFRITDRCPSYSFIPKKYHQYCWPHLKRDIKAISDRLDEAESAIGLRLEAARKTIFTTVDTLEASKEPQPELTQTLIGTIKQFRYALRDGAKLTDTKTAGFCRNIIRDWQCLWHFLRHEEVESSNNHGERMLRHNVIWRKLSHGTQSVRGDRYVERISTTQATCRLQKRDLLSFLTEAVQAWWEGEPSPSLIN